MFNYEEYISKEERDVLKIIKDTEKLNLKEKKELLIRAGIITKSGRLSSHYTR